MKYLFLHVNFKIKLKHLIVYFTCPNNRKMRKWDHKPCENQNYWIIPSPVYCMSYKIENTDNCFLFFITHTTPISNQHCKQFILCLSFYSPDSVRCVQRFCEHVILIPDSRNMHSYVQESTVKYRVRLLLHFDSFKFAYFYV